MMDMNKSLFYKTTCSITRITPRKDLENRGENNSFRGTASNLSIMNNHIWIKTRLAKQYIVMAMVHTLIGINWKCLDNNRVRFPDHPLGFEYNLVLTINKQMLWHIIIHTTFSLNFLLRLIQI